MPVKCIHRGTFFACLSVVAASLCAVVSSGCIGVTRLPAKTQGPTGTSIDKSEIDLAFLQPGATRREEVVSRLGRIDTGFSNPRVFWGRWSDSKWGHWIILAGPGSVGGDVGRDWHVRNVLVSFDDSEVMQTHKVIDDERVLERELGALLAKAPPLDLSKPISILLTTHSPGRTLYGPHEMSLAKEGIQVGSAQISPLKVTRISYERFYGNPKADSICHSLHLTEKKPLGRKFMYCTSAANVATVLQYLRQSGSPNIRWE